MSLAALSMVGMLMQTQIVAPLPRVPLPIPAASAVVASANQQRKRAGQLTGRVLTVALDVVSARWKPEGETDPEVPAFAFAEHGQSPTVPGPLLRATVGTDVHITLANRTDSALVIGGLRAGTNSDRDTIQLAAGASRELRFRLTATGTYAYWGAFAGTTAEDRLWLDSQLNGAIVVDAPGARTDDYIFLISEWFFDQSDRRQAWEIATVINGKGFPYTERLTLAQGDSVRFRVINMTGIKHPMHLHGFYYRIEERSAVRVPPGQRALSNTDLVPTFATEVLSFVPTTPGNWLFHCHFAFHVNDEVSLVGAPRDSASMQTSALMSHDGQGSRAAEHDMRGLVIPIQVTPAPSYRAPIMANARTIRLHVQDEPHALPGAVSAYGFVEQKGDSIPKPHTVRIPGPVLELTRGQPVRIVVKNQLAEPTSVHWHGLEIESFPDGVPHWSGLGSRVYTQIAPRDSFVAEFVPPRAGTFPYHSHFNDRLQMLSGMYGALIVVDRPRDLVHDHLIVVGGGGAAIEAKRETPFALVNGRESPSPLRLTVGETHRLRIVSIHPDWAVRFTLRNDLVTARWRAIAKDGADLPRALATFRPAHVVMGPGETADFEFTPTTPGRWRLDVASEGPGWQIPLAVIVEAKARVQKR